MIIHFSRFCKPAKTKKKPNCKNVGRSYNEDNNAFFSPTARATPNSSKIPIAFLMYTPFSPEKIALLRAHSPTYLNPSEAAIYLGVSMAYLRTNVLKSGLVPVIRANGCRSVRRSDLDRYMDRMAMLDAAAQERKLLIARPGWVQPLSDAEAAKVRANPPALLTVPQAAAYLQTSLRTMEGALARCSLVRPHKQTRQGPIFSRRNLDFARAQGAFDRLLQQPATALKRKLDRTPTNFGQKIRPTL